MPRAWRHAILSTVTGAYPLMDRGPYSLKTVSLEQSGREIDLTRTCMKLFEFAKRLRTRFAAKSI